MGLLDSVLGSVLGGNASSPIGNVLGSLLGGGMGNQGMGNQGMGGLGGMLAQGLGGGQGMSGQGLGGGLGGLLAQFEQAGLGNIAQSWVGTGANQPVSPQQLQNVFGQEQVQSMANQAGMQPGDFLSQLSQHLPRAVDAMTPDGRLPNEGTMSV